MESHAFFLLLILYNLYTLRSYLTIFKSYTGTSHATIVNYAHRNTPSYLEVLHANVVSCIKKCKNTTKVHSLHTLYINYAHRNATS